MSLSIDTSSCERRVKILLTSHGASGLKQGTEFVTLITQNRPALNRPPSGAPSQVCLSSIPSQAVKKLHFEEDPIVEPLEFRPAMEVRGKVDIGYEDRLATKYVTNYELTLLQRGPQDRH